MRKLPTALLWGLALLLAAGALFRLLPRPHPATAKAEVTFSLGSLPQALLDGATALLGNGKMGGEEILVTRVQSRPVLRPRGYGGAPSVLPSATLREGRGQGILEGVYREGSFFAGGTVYLAPGAHVWVENENACFFVQILSISEAE